MDKAFIHKVKQTVLKHIEDELFGVNELASEIGFSQSQLLRKIKTVTGKTVAEFIKEIRLQEAAKLIKEGQYTASEISFQVGFNSPSYFNKCFHDYFGVTPGEYKEKFENQIIEEETQSKHIKPVRFKHQKNILLGILSVTVIIISFILIKNSLNTRKKNQSYSIAVLPIKCLSNDKSNQYFADGVMDDIMNHLSSIKEFKIISRTTMEQYRKTNKTAPEISKELRISHIIESSFQKYKDSVMIIVQLIDAKKDKHIWSKKFEREFGNIFTLESEIAKEIASELKITLTSKELKKIEKIPTKNLKAYNNYLMGRHFWNKRTIEDSKKSIGYYEKSIQEDEDYGLAYAGLSDTYLILAFIGSIANKKEWLDQAVKFALKALELDKNLSMPHAVLGSKYTYFDHNWEKAEREFLKAIELDPNYATAYQYYAELLQILGRNQEARDIIDKALLLEPLSFVINWRSTEIYLHQGNFEKALEGSKRCHDLIDNHNYLSRQDFNLYYFSGNEKEALKVFKKIVKEIDSTEANEIYQASGFDGLFRVWMERTDDDFLDAKIYACFGEDEKALELLESLYKKNKLPITFNTKYDFKDLRKHPRFIALQKKMYFAD